MAGKRCGNSVPGFGRCGDRSGQPHGCWFKPGQVDDDLTLSEDEARQLTDYLRTQFIHARKWPHVHTLFDRIDDHLRSAAIERG